MLKRKLEKNINSWIKNSNKALLVYGVRQAGKTFLIRKCLEMNNCDYVEFNFIDEPSLIPLISNSSSTEDLILKLSLHSKKQITPHKTFIFFDEVQKCKELVTKIKFLVEDNRFRYVLSGSLLGIELTNLRSAPVGYLEILTLFPLDFEEFTQIFIKNDSTIPYLKNCFVNKLQIDHDINKKLLEIFNLYLIIGGMPQAIQKYLDTENINEVINIHNSIINLYKLDFTQYEENDRKLLLNQIYDLIPAQLNDLNKRFKIAAIENTLRYSRIEDNFIWLWKSGVGLPVFNTTEPKIPLLINKKSSLFKLFLSDIGLLTTMYGSATKLKILNNNSDLNKGAIYENVIAQELYAHGFSPYYFNSHKLGELDFVIEYNGLSLPIEVKSGKDYNRHSALNNVLNIPDYNINEAFVFANCNIFTKGKITYYPIYMIMFLESNVEVGIIPIESMTIN